MAEPKPVDLEKEERITSLGKCPVCGENVGDVTRYITGETIYYHFERDTKGHITEMRRCKTKSRFSNSKK